MLHGLVLGFLPFNNADK
jgi:hypothetical protein